MANPINRAGWLMVVLVVCTLKGCSAAAGSDGRFSFMNYLPMKFLEATRSARETSVVSKARFYDFLPSELNGNKANYLEIRSTFYGSVKVLESAQFGLSVNVSAKNAFDLASVKLEYTAVNDTILLQAKIDHPSVKVGLSSLVKLAIAVGAIMAVVFLFACGCLCFWLAKFDTNEEDDVMLPKPPTPVSTCSDLSLSERDVDSLLKSWEAQDWMREAEMAALTEDIQSNFSKSSKPQLANGVVFKSSVSSRNTSVTGTGTNGKQRRRHRPAPAYKSRDVSSSEELSSFEHSRAKRKASLKRNHVTIHEGSELALPSEPKESQMKVTDGKGVNKGNRADNSDYDITSGDVGFSSGNENSSRRHKLRNRLLHSQKPSSSLEELEWDEYDTEQAAITPPYVSPANGWLVNGGDHTHNEDTDKEDWPPPIESDIAELGDSDDAVFHGANISDVRDAITSAMDSVNSDMRSNQRPAVVRSGSAKDDGYETGAVVVNGGGKAVSPPPPVELSSSTDIRAAQQRPLTHNGPTAPAAVHKRSEDGDSRRYQGGKPSPSRLQMTMLTSLTILGLLTGAYAVHYNLTSVEFVIFVPNNYFRQINVFVNQSSRVKLDVTEKPKKTAVHLFENENPILTDLTVDRCTEFSRDCEHGCNRKTGACVCSLGYLIFEDTKCADRDDCLYLPCPHSEQCTNTYGGFICSCPTDHVRNENGTCVECATYTCPPNTFEVSPCPKKQCLPCTAECPENHYISRQCSRKSDLHCTPCSPQCDERQYELQPCDASSDRKCDSIANLPAARGSENLILESLGSRLNVESIERLLDEPTKGLQFTTNLIRGSSINIKVSVKSVNLFPTLKPVDHTDSNDNEEFIAGNLPYTVLTQFCPQPMPVKYELMPVQHTNVTAARTCADCGVDPRQPCKTYKVFGKSAPLHPFDKSMVCTKPDALVDMFNLTSFLTESRTIVVPPSQSCEVIRGSCDQCAQQCADQIQTNRQGNCTVTAEDDPNSWSPRLMHCQNCCLNRQCKDMCSAEQQCHPVRCWRGNVAEFLLSPTFPSGTMEFYCHVELDENIQLLSLDYTVLHNDMELKNFSMILLQSKDSVISKSHSDGLLTVQYSTGIESVPELLHGDFNLDGITPDITAGLYEPQGKSASRVSVSRLDIVPKRPFSFSTKWWSDYGSCASEWCWFWSCPTVCMENITPVITLQKQSSPVADIID